MIDSSKLVAQQLRLVELKHEMERTGQRPPRVKVDDVHYGPCILFSRESGSACDLVAERVGEHFGWPVFNRKIVEQIAERAQVRQQLVESIDEQVRSRWRRFLHPLRESHGITPSTYLYHLYDIVLSLGSHGDVIIIGHGAQFLLPAACALRVLVVEPMVVRARHLAAEQQISPEEATKRLRDEDAARAAFIRKVFHQDTASPLNYDLILNTAYLNVEAAVVAVVNAAQEKLPIKKDVSHA